MNKGKRKKEDKKERIYPYYTFFNQKSQQHGRPNIPMVGYPTYNIFLLNNLKGFLKAVTNSH